MTADSEELVARYVRDVWGARDPEAARRFLVPGFRRHLSPSGPPLDIDRQVERLAGLMAALPDAALRIEGVVASGELVAFRSILTGTHRGPLLGIPATGRRVTVRLVDMVRIEDGRFAEQWGGPDMLDLVLQLGASITAPD